MSEARLTTPRGDTWAVATYGGSTRPCAVYLSAAGPDPEMPCELTPSRARELAGFLCMEADRAERINERGDTKR